MARIGVKNVLPGRYWIGDPELAIPAEGWRKVVLAAREGKTSFRVGTLRIVMFFINDRSDFFDIDANRYVVTSGVLAAIPSQLLTNPARFGNGHEFLFTERFECWYESTDIEFGPIHIELR